jgi:predicted DNA binding CopG/RHH family protein
MTSLNNGNALAALHLIDLEKRTANKQGVNYQNLITAIGEVGGDAAVHHLTDLETRTANKQGENYQNLITAIGRAGRIS